MFKGYLSDAKNKNTVVSVYSNPDDISLCHCGFVVGISNDDVIIAAISPVGLYDGFILKKCEDIFRVDGQDQYAEKILKLYKLREQTHPEIKLKTGNLITDLAQFALDNNFVFTIKLHNAGGIDARGFVSTIHNDTITMLLLDDYGIPDGDTIISKDAIVFAYCDSEMGIALKLLAENP